MNRTLAGAAIGATVLLSACGRSAGSPQPTASSGLHPASALIVTTLMPGPDLAAARLTDVPTLVTPFHLDASDQGRTITLIGAYADPARTVVFFRGVDGIRLDSVDVQDDAGLINGGSSGQGRAAPGDAVFSLDAGPQPVAGGLAHLRIKIQDVETWPPPSTRRIVSGDWSYAIDLTVQPSTPIAAPAQFSVGRWKATIEVLEVTPSVIHLQAVINGPSPPELVGPSVPALLTLLDPSGHPIDSIEAGAGITVPKQQVNPLNYHNSRIYYQWPRPSGAATLQLRFQGGGGTYAIPIVIPALS